MSIPHERLLAVIETQNEIAATALDPDALMELVLRRARTLTGADAAVLEVPEEEEMVYRAVSGAAEPFLDLRLPREGGLSGECLRTCEIQHCHDAESDARVNVEACRRLGAMSLLCVPLRRGARAVGVLSVYAAAPDAFHYGDERTLDLLAGVAAAHLTHSETFAQRRKESLYDVVTGLPNRRAFEQRLGSEVARIRRHGGELALCLVDLDGFGEINDTLGHAVGDEVLWNVARRLERVRGEDIAFRVGGDEFGIIFIGVDAAGAQTAAKRLEVGVLSDQDCGGVSVSWGVAELEGGDPIELLNAAEQDLHRNQRARRRARQSFWNDR